MASKTQDNPNAHLDDVLLLDMDGTVADYASAMLHDLNALRAPGEPPASLDGAQPPHIVERMQLIKSQPGWWRALRPCKLGFDVYHAAKRMGFIVHVLTRGPWSTPSAWTEKVQWCREHFGDDVGVTITEDKGLVYGRVLVDDHPDYCARWLTWRPRGLVVMPATDANASVRHPQVIRSTARTWKLFVSAWQTPRRSRTPNKTGSHLPKRCGSRSIAAGKNGQNEQPTLHQGLRFAMHHRPVVGVGQQEIHKMRRNIQTSNAPAAIGPYEQAVSVSAREMVFCSGQIPLDPTTMELVGNGDVTAQAEQVMKNLGAVLDAAGCSFADVVRCTIFLKDMGDFAAVNAVYSASFPIAKPSRACVEVARLPKDVSVEIDAIAVKQ